MFKEIIVRNGVDTMTKAFNYAVQKYGDKECLGTRQILGINSEISRPYLLRLLHQKNRKKYFHFINVPLVSFRRGRRSAEKWQSFCQISFGRIRMDELQHGSCLSRQLWSWFAVSFEATTGESHNHVCRNKSRMDDIMSRGI